MGWVRAIRRCLPELLAAGLVLVALVGGLRATRGLAVPPEVDLYRDAGAAQSMLDGRLGEDPMYPGERSWYTPLVPAVIAVISAATDASPIHVYARAGAVLNLLAPIGFFLLARLLFGRWLAVACLASFLFLGDPGLNTWSQATYTPWLWPVHFVQGVFYLAAAAWVHGLRSGRRIWDISAGLLLGLTFLGHVAPAAILSGAVALVTAHTLVTGAAEARRRHLERLLTIGALSLLAALPLLAPLAGAYGLHTVNPVPARFGGQSERSMLEALFSARFLIAGVGAVALWRRPDWARPGARVVMAALLTVVMALLVYEAFADSKTAWPMLVPTFHFFFYFTALASLLFGLGMYAIARLVVRQERWQQPAAVAAAVALGLVLYPHFLRADSQSKWRARAQAFEADTDLGITSRFARTQAGASDVFLTDDRHAMYAVVPAGRHVVCVPDTMSNPYVDHEQRVRDRAAMYGAMRSGDETAFRTLAQRYGVTYVVAAGSANEDCCAAPASTPLFLEAVLAADGLTIYRVRPTKS